MEILGLKVFRLCSHLVPQRKGLSLRFQVARYRIYSTISRAIFTQIKTEVN